MGIDISVRGRNRLLFQGTGGPSEDSPTKTGAWWWKGLLEDADNNRSVVGEEDTEFFDTSRTIPSVVYPAPILRAGVQVIYYNYRESCCEFTALVEPGHTDPPSGSPYGDVHFTLLEKPTSPLGKEDLDITAGLSSEWATLKYSPLSPGKVGTEPVEMRWPLDVGAYFLTANYDTPSVPDSITSIPGFTKNPYLHSSGFLDFRVLRAPTLTYLWVGAVTKTQITFFVKVENNRLITGNDVNTQVYPGTKIKLFAVDDGAIVGNAVVPSTGTTVSFVIPAKHGPQTFFAQYYGNIDEEPSRSASITLDLY